MSKNGQIYIQVYEKLEKEVLELSSSIHFVDEQLYVYSIQIADLITRCCIEIESVIKDIYRNNNEEYTQNEEKEIKPAKALKWIEKNRNISKKKIYINTKYFHFKEANLELIPLNYKNGSDDDYYSSYNAIKHDRNKNLKKANLYTLLRALGALYIFNIYYLNARIYLSKDRYGLKMDKSQISSIFNFYVAPCKKLPLLTSESGLKREFCLYEIIKYEQDYAFIIRYLTTNDEEDRVTITNRRPEFQEYAKDNFDKVINIDKFMNKITSILPVFQEDIITDRDFKKIKSISSIKMKPAYFAELVKD